MSAELESSEVDLDKPIDIADASQVVALIAHARSLDARLKRAELEVERLHNYAYELGALQLSVEYLLEVLRGRPVRALRAIWGRSLRNAPPDWIRNRL